jgi:ribosomal protein S18 acetylase RimI-like enzyme
MIRMRMPRLRCVGRVPRSLPRGARRSSSQPSWLGHDGHRGWVYYLAVARAFRRLGVGTMLMRSAEQWCRERSVPKLQLMVRSESVEMAHFYGALGYEKSDVVVLAKWLKSEPD